MAGMLGTAYRIRLSQSRRLARETGKFKPRCDCFDVLKWTSQAIVNARRNHRVYGSIPEATYVETSESKAQFIDGERYGIAFFGTPHRGGNGASLGKVVASIIRRTLWNPANDFMSFLRKDSRLANDLTEEFRHDLEDYYYLSFFETIPMGMMVC